MCTIVLEFRPGHPWPLLAAANRDEMVNRPWRGPARHWPDRPDCVAGLDVLANGSWLGLNDHGLMAAMLNRFASLGPAPGKRSRGELVLEALDHAEADQAAQALSQLDPRAYRPFNMVIGDGRSLYWLRHDGERIEARPIAPGFHMLTAHELDDRASPRIAAYFDPFRAAAKPDPETGDWQAWTDLLARRRSQGPPGQEDAALCIVRDDGFGTVSSALLALPADPTVRPVWLFCPGRPGESPYEPVDLG